MLLGEIKTPLVLDLISALVKAAAMATVIVYHCAQQFLVCANKDCFKS